MNSVQVKRLTLHYNGFCTLDFPDESTLKPYRVVMHTRKGVRVA